MGDFERLPGDAFQFNAGSRRDLYFAVLHVFNAANERLETALVAEDVHRRLADVGFLDVVGEDDVEAALRHLSGHLHLLEASQNYGASHGTAVDFERKNVQYSLTPRGEAEFAGAVHMLARLKESGALQTAVLDAIADRLDGLHALLKRADPTEDPQVFTALLELEGHLDSLRDNTKRFNNELQRLLRVDKVDFATFHSVKDSTVGYLKEFLENLEMRAGRIGDALDRVESQSTLSLRMRALNGANFPPGASEQTRTDWLAARGNKWEGLRSWFAASPDGQTGVRRLHEVARQAIVSLLETLDRIVDARRRSSSAAEDFRTAARWFATAESESDLHRLWAAAFGLSPARHAHLGHDDAELIAPGTEWAKADPVHVSPKLRTSGRAEHIGRTARVRDVGAVRAARRAAALEERRQIEAAWRSLATDGPVRLSTFATLEHTLFERLLDLLGLALAEPPASDGMRRAGTSDGRFEIVLYPPRDESEATLRTPRGTFTGPDYVVSVSGGMPA
ncbi:TIGR02677 family protein [Nocardiopsis mangrovi]|uniref:TIGR02677 family protein n=1 Tax=Nocardiopsis mangrovi TaxID=1179818 RepID=A0ABV9DVC5_9ACTN